VEKSELSYSQAVARLDEILELIERGEVDIDELSSLVEEAAELVTLSRKKLTQAEIQVKVITERLEREVEEETLEETALPEEPANEDVPF